MTIFTTLDTICQQDLSEPAYIRFRLLFEEHKAAVKLVEDYFWCGGRKEGQKIDARAEKFLRKCGKLPASTAETEAKPDG